MKILLKSTRLTPAFLFIFCLLSIILDTQKVAARPNKCEQIRQVRRLAFQENLDGRNLAALEDIFCRGNGGYKPDNSEMNFPPDNASTDCVKLTAMKRIAQMTNGQPQAPPFQGGERLTKSDKNMVRMIRGQQQITCEISRENSQHSWNWGNGEKAKWGSTWYYPDGKKAAQWNSDWYYSNGEKAKWGSNWYYPNGEKAKWGSTWYYPNGQRASSNNLLGWGCSVVSTKQCRQATNRVKQTQGFWHDIEIVDLSWKAYQINKSRY